MHWAGEWQEALPAAGGHVSATLPVAPPPPPREVYEGLHCTWPVSTWGALYLRALGIQQQIKTPGHVDRPWKKRKSFTYYYFNDTLFPAFSNRAPHFHSALVPVTSEADPLYHSIPSTQPRADTQPLLSKTLHPILFRGG